MTVFKVGERVRVTQEVVDSDAGPDEQGYSWPPGGYFNWSGVIQRIEEWDATVITEGHTEDLDVQEYDTSKDSERHGATLEIEADDESGCTMAACYFEHALGARPVIVLEDRDRGDEHAPGRPKPRRWH